MKFSQQFANGLRRWEAQPGDTWHLDEGFLTINGKTYDVWRAVDQYGNVLDIFVQSWRNKAAAIKFFRKLLKRGIYVPRVLITDTLASYEAAKKEVMVSVEHRRHRRLNTRAEHSHQPMRQRERTMRCFTSAGQPSDSCPPSDRSTHTFAHVGTWLKAKEYRRERTRRFQVWNEVVSFQNAVSAIISRADDYSTAT